MWWAVHFEKMARLEGWGKRARGTWLGRASCSNSGYGEGQASKVNYPPVSIDQMVVPGPTARAFVKPVKRGQVVCLGVRGHFLKFKTHPWAPGPGPKVFLLKPSILPSCPKGKCVECTLGENTTVISLPSPSLCLSLSPWQWKGWPVDSFVVAQSTWKKCQAFLLPTVPASGTDTQ